MSRFLASIKYVLIGAAVSGFAFPATAFAAGKFPEKPLTLILPFSPGGTADPIGRMMAEFLSKEIGQQIIVENKPGASGNIAYSHVARADPDGYTMLMSYSSTTACSHALSKDVTWKMEDFTPLAGFAISPVVIVSPSAVTADDLQSFFDYVKAHPGEVNYAIAGRGTLGHISSELLVQKTGVKMEPVVYKGSGDVFPDLLTNRVQMLMTGVPSVTQHVAAGTIKVLATTGATRHPQLPDTPTVAESGFPELEAEDWYGVFVRSDTDEAKKKKILEAVTAAATDKAFIEKGASASIIFRHIHQSAALERVKNDTARCEEVVQAAGIEKE